MKFCVKNFSPQLTRLTLYDNQIHTIHGDAFDGVQKWAFKNFQGTEISFQNIYGMQKWVFKTISWCKSDFLKHLRGAKVSF